MTPGPWRRLALGVLLPVLLFSWLRVPLLSGPAAERGWNSDSAIFGLMAQRVRDGDRFPFFFWGQSYLGPLTPILAAGISYARRSARCEPFDLRLAVHVQHGLGLLAWGAGLLLLFGPVTALATMLLLAIGPAFFPEASTQPETLLFLGGVLFWLGARLLRRDGETPSGPLLAFGAASGLAWWMNPGVVFVVAPALVLLALRSAPCPEIRRALAPAGRLRFSAAALGWTPPRALVLAAHVLQLYCGVRILTFLTAPLTGLSVPAFLWHGELFEPLSLLVLVHGGMALPGIRPGRVLRAIRPAVTRALPFAAGFVLGNAPALAGRFLFPQEGSYSFDAALLPDAHALSRVGTFLRRDLLPFTSGSSSFAAHVFAWGLVLGAALAGVRRRSRLAALLSLRPGAFGGTALAAGVVLLSLYFHLIRERAPSQVHYLVLALPCLVALAAEGWRHAFPSRRAGALLSAVLAACGLFALHDGFRTAREAILAEPDPLALTRAISQAGYAVCYADFWIAYEHQFLSRETVRFIPYHSRDRNPAESRVLRGLPGRKCLVAGDGSFREFLPEDERNQGGPARRRAAGP